MGGWEPVFHGMGANLIKIRQVRRDGGGGGEKRGDKDKETTWALQKNIEKDFEAWGCGGGGESEW